MANEDIESNYGTLQVVNLIVYILSMSLWLVSLVGFLLLRNVQPFKARSHALLILLLCCIPVNSTKYFLILRGTEDCVRDSWLEASFGNATMFIYFMRAYRLLVIFNVTKKHFEEEESSEKDKKKRYFWQRPSQATDKSLLIILGFIILFFMLFPLVASIQNHGNSTEICTSAAVRIGRGVAVIAFFLIIGINILLHRVHDGYFLKNEYRVLAAVSVVSAVVGVAYLVAPTVLMRIISAIVLYTLCMVLYTISFIVPSVLAIRNKYYKYDDDSSSHTTDHESRIETTSKSEKSGDPGTTTVVPTDVPAGPVDEKEFKHFAGLRKAYKVLSDQLSYKYLEDFLIHYQDIKTSDCLLFWYHLKEFRKTKKEFLTGKAWILYQKYLQRGGYRYIECCNDVQLAAMETTLKASMEEDGIPVDFNFFDEVIESIEAILIQNLFVPFFKSDFYAQYKQAAGLHSGIALLKSGATV